jgi:hypothetical protein
VTDRAFDGRDTHQLPSAVKVVAPALHLEALRKSTPITKAAPSSKQPDREQTLRNRLHKHGLLVSIDTARQTLLVRRTLLRCPRHVLQLKASDLAGSTMRSRPVTRLVFPTLSLCLFVVSQPGKFYMPRVVTSVHPSLPACPNGSRRGKSGVRLGTFLSGPQSLVS